MTKPPIPTENSKTKGQHTNTTKNFDYTTIADRLWRSVGVTSHPTGVVKPGLKGTNLPTHRKKSVINHYTIEILFIMHVQIDFHKDGYMLKANQESKETLLYNLTVLKYY